MHMSLLVALFMKILVVPPRFGFFISNKFLQKDIVMQKSNQIIPLHVVKLLLQREAQRMQSYPPKKVFPTLCSNSPFSDCFSSSAAIKGENSAQCSLTWKKVKVESYPFSGKRFPKIFKTPSPLLLLPPLLTSPSNQVDSPPPCSYILMTNPSESPLRNIRHFCTKLSEISVQNRFVGRSVSCQ